MPVPSSCRLCMDAVQSLLVRAYYPIACMVKPFVEKPKADHKKLDQTSVLALDPSWSDSEAFAQAVALVQERGGGLPNATRLGLYALYKQTEQPAPEDPPPRVNALARAKVVAAHRSCCTDGPSALTAPCAAARSGRRGTTCVT